MLLFVGVHQRAEGIEQILTGMTPVVSDLIDQCVDQCDHATVIGFGLDTEAP
jgi:hypothetical protein